MKISSLHVARERDQRVAVVRLSYHLPDGVSPEAAADLARAAELTGDALATVSLQSQVRDTSDLLAAQRWAGGPSWGRTLADRLPGGEAELVGVAAADGTGTLDTAVITARYREEHLITNLRDLGTMLGVSVGASTLPDAVQELRFKLPPLVRDLRGRPAACEADLKRRMDERDKEVAALQDHLRRECASSQALQAKVADLEERLRDRESDLVAYRRALADADRVTDDLRDRMSDPEGMAHALPERR